MVLEYDVTVDDQWLRVFRPMDEDAAPYEGWVIVVGAEHIPIDEVSRFRDGGTTVMRSRAGTLTVFAPHKQRAPEWQTPQPGRS